MAGSFPDSELSINYLFAPPSQRWSYVGPTGGITDTADDEAQAAGASGIINCVTGVQVTNSHATVDTEVVIKDGSTIIWRGWVVADGGHISANFIPPLQGSDAAAINVANITDASATLFNLQGYTTDA